MVKTSPKTSPTGSPASPAKVLKNKEDPYLTEKECYALKEMDKEVFLKYYCGGDKEDAMWHYFQKKYAELFLFLKKNGVSTVEPRLIGSIHSRKANVHSIGALYHFVVERQRSLGLRESYEKKLKKALEEWVERRGPREFDPLCDYFLYAAGGEGYRYYSGEHYTPICNSMFTGIWLNEEDYPSDTE